MNQQNSSNNGQLPKTSRLIVYAWATAAVVAVLFIGASSKLHADGVPSSQTTAQVSIEPRVRPGASTRAQLAKPTFRSDMSLVLVDVTVLDSRNRFVTGLRADTFRLLEDKVEQDLRFVSSEDAPVSVGVVFDTSGSMASRLQQSKQSVGSFLSTANPADEFFLIQFNDRAELSVPFTSSIEEIHNRIMFVPAKGTTALFDAVYLALNQMKTARNGRKALLLVSDGSDNFSRYSENELAALIRETDVQIYAIGFFEPQFSRYRRSISQRRSGSAILARIAELTGGRYFPMRNMKDLPDVTQKIAFELHNQYTLGYVSSNTDRNGKYRRLQVKLTKAPGYARLRAYHRLGYYAPTK